MLLKECFRCERVYRFDLIEKCPACGLRTKFQSPEFNELEEKDSKELYEKRNEQSTTSLASKNRNSGIKVSGLESSNYTRGNIFRDSNSLKMSFPEIFDNPFTVGSNAFVIAHQKQEESQGILLSDMVHLVIREREIILLGFPEVVFKLHVENLIKFEFASIDIPLLFFPPGIPPQRVGMFQIEWMSDAGKFRKMHVLFPDMALIPSELEFPSEKVHNALGDLDRQRKFLSSPFYNPEPLKSFAKNLILHLGGMPDEVNKRPCHFNQYLEINM